MVDITAVLDDLDTESAELDATVASLDSEQWSMATPAQGWTIAHQIAHLAWTDSLAVESATRPDTFHAAFEDAAADPERFVDEAAEQGARRPQEELLDSWRAGRTRLRHALAAAPDDTRLPWFGPAMRPASMATARIMETWAHGQDVVDALGVIRTPTERLRHVAHIGVRARDSAYAVNSLQAPNEPFRVELDGPNGDFWTWGPAEAQQRVVGSALEFCLVVTQRRHRDDTSLQAQGAEADTWLSIAQAFAGPPGIGRKAGQFS